jgi:hypothetical protein
MAIFNIYHPFNGDMNLMANKNEFEYQQVGSVEASSIDEAYFKSQNWNDPWNMDTPCRSTSVGDIITDEHGVVHMVKGMGFEEVSTDVLKFTKGIESKNIEAIGQQMLDNPEDYGLI